MKRWRYGLGGAGILLLLFGVVRLVIEVPGKLPGLALWLVGIVVIHDGLLAPLVVAVGWLLARTVPPRARRYAQSALIVGGLITVIAVPMIYRQDTQPASKAWLLQNYGRNLAVLLGLVIALNLLAYARTAASGFAERSTDEQVSHPPAPPEPLAPPGPDR
jgi:Ca2+/H+ antiporter